MLWANDVDSGSRIPRPHGPRGWQVFVIHTESGIDFAIARSGERLKYAVDIEAPENRLASFEALEGRLRGLKPHQWVMVDQWNRGTSVVELDRIKQRLGGLCTMQKLRCVYSF
jgi:hypothetical protein